MKLKQTNQTDNLILYLNLGSEPIFSIDSHYTKWALNL